MPPRQTEPGSPAVSSIDALLQAFASEKFGRDAQSIRRLTGGASQEIWQINMAEDEAYIVRRPPGGEIKPGANQVTPDDEVKLLQIAFKAGICVPEIVHSFQHDEPLYPGYVMRFIAGETMARKILRDTEFDSIRGKLAYQCGAALAAIHAIPVADCPDLPTSFAEDELEKYSDILHQHGHPQPVFELAIRWLRDNLPPTRAASLVHGDFRNGNLMIRPDIGLASILDWELTHLGDPMEDLGWICVPSWRFGAIDNPVGGFGRRQDLYAGYTDNGGQIDETIARYWEIFGALKWGIMCLIMVEIFEAGVDTSIERAAIGRRASETQIDLLIMLTQENATY
ncbi:phosphotransferase family protein [Alphaproteobacteria bacterium]|jgi:aminoglycoside phosphotransferase (APT) family kinase protein|nr:phosphotransferase family protein [Alphaproteobacteria bacterium]